MFKTQIIKHKKKYLKNIDYPYLTGSGEAGWGGGIIITHQENIIYIYLSNILINNVHYGKDFVIKT